MDRKRGLADPALLVQQRYDCDGIRGRPCWAASLEQMSIRANVVLLKVARGPSGELDQWRRRPDANPLECQ